MVKAIIKLGDIQIQKQKFHQHKGSISIKNVDIDKTVVSNEVPFDKKGFKYFTGQKGTKKNKPLCEFLPKMTGCRKDFDETKYISFLLKDNELLEKYNETWKKVSNAIKKRFDSNSVYIKKYLRTKIKSYKGKINTNFHNNKIPKEGSQYICLSVILLDSILKTDKKQYPQVFLKECKYVIKETKIYNYITNDLEISSSSDETILLEKIQIEKSSDYEEKSDEEILKKIQMKKNSDEENSDKENKKKKKY